MSEKNDLKYDVTIVICTYNPRWDKLKKTLDACITQKNINFQIVITDDGSPNNLFEQVRIYFQNNQFEDYKLSALEKNKGTVCNVLNGEYTKTKAHLQDVKVYRKGAKEQ